MKKFLISLIICISSFMFYANNVKAEEYNITLSGMQNNFNNNVVGWYTSFTRKGLFYTDTFSTTTTNSVQFYFDSFSNANPNVSYGLVSGLVYFNNGGNDIVKPYQLVAVRLNSGNNRYNSCTFSRYTDNIEIYQDNSSSINVPMNEVYNFTCYMNTNISYNNIELVINQDYATNDSNYVQKSCRYGIATKLTIDYFFNDNTSVVSAINNNTQVQQDVKNNTKETNDLIKNDNTSGAESSADDLKNNSAFQDNTGLSAIISMPLTFVNSLTNTCQPINLTIPYMDVDVSIPCMQSVITNKMPLLANLIKIVINGFIVYRILLDIFQIVRNAKNPEDDRIEVLDL